MNGYYEAILQLRPLDKKILNYVYNQIKKDSKVLLIKEIILKKGNGVDLYLSSWRFTISLARKIKRVFKCRDLKITRKLFGFNKQKSKKIYKMTILLRK